jgi:hypothetical protein
VLLRKTTHTTSFFFLIILALPQILIIALQLWQLHVQHEALERLERESLQTITIDAKALTWKNKKEVSIDGRMFDIKSYRVENGKYILTGLFDEKETSIKDFLKKQASGSGSPLIKLLLIAQSFIITIFLISFPFLIILRKRISFFKVQFSFHFKELLVPPPKPLFVFY